MTEMHHRRDDEIEFRADGDENSNRLHIPDWFKELIGWVKDREDSDGGIRAAGDNEPV